jgi:succinoglycan biosynthesis transport protein ExoP
MQEEISLREIIETIWNGKWIIIVTTIVSMLISGIFSFFILSPTYEAVSTISLGTNSAGQEEGQQQHLNSYADSVKTDIAINRLIEKLKLNRNEYSINSIRESINVEVVTNTNVMKLKVKGKDPSTITNIANLLAFELGARIEISDRSQKIVEFKNRLIEIDDSMNISKKELEESNNQLKENPEKLLTKQIVADEPYIQSILEETTPDSNKELGAMQLDSESINPVYSTLKERIAVTTINLAMLSAEKGNLETDILKNEVKIEELEQKMDEVKLKTLKSERMLDGFNAVFISPAIKSTDPVGPKKLLNIMIAAIVGVMLSIMYVFVRDYWRSSSVPRSTGSGISVSS